MASAWGGLTARGRRAIANNLMWLVWRCLNNKRSGREEGWGGMLVILYRNC